MEHPLDDTKPVIRLIDEVNDADGLWVEDREFISATIQGPQVLYASGDCTFLDSSFTFDTTFDSILIPLEGTHPWCGLLGIRRCEFIDCTFFRIAFAGPPEQLEHFRSQVDGAAQ